MVALEQQDERKGSSRPQKQILMVVAVDQSLLRKRAGTRGHMRKKKVSRVLSCSANNRVVKVANVCGAPARLLVDLTTHIRLVCRFQMTQEDHPSLVAWSIHRVLNHSRHFYRLVVAQPGNPEWRRQFVFCLVVLWLDEFTLCIRWYCR